MKKHPTVLWALLLCAWAVYLLFCPASAGAAVADGLTLCARSVLPALFPFFVCVELMGRMGVTARISARLGAPLARLLHTSPAGAGVWAAGIVGGYPAGAQCAAALCRARQLSASEAEHLCGFCNNAGPAFILSMAGAQLFDRPAAGFALWGGHIAASLLTGVLLRPRQPYPVIPPSRQTSSARPALSAAFTQSVKTAGAILLQVCMFVVTFSVLTAILSDLLPQTTPPALRAGLTGALELTNGIRQLQLGALSEWATFVLCAFLLGFGGLGVAAQVASILQESGLSAHGYLRAKFLHGLLCAAFSLPAAQALHLQGAPAWHRLWPPLALFAVLVTGFLSFRKVMSGNPRADGV